MPQNTRTATQLCTNKLRLGVSLSVPILVFGLANISQAATVPFTFELNYDAFVVGVPSPTTPTLLTMLSGSGLYAPFGRATYSEAGTITFAMLPFWRVCTVVRIEYFYRFVQRGSRHIHGDTLSRVAKPIIPSSGNPSPDYFATFTSSGTGQITAPGLTAVPEPTTMTLLGAAMASLGGLAAVRSKRNGSTAAV